MKPPPLAPPNPNLPRVKANIHDRKHPNPLSDEFDEIMHQRRKALLDKENSSSVRSGLLRKLRTTRKTKGERR